MAFTIDGFENIDFKLPHGKGKYVTVNVPPYDCITPQDMDKIKDKIKELGDSIDVLPPTEVVRIFLLQFSNTKAQREAIEALPARQLGQVDEIWSKESGLSMGESEDSTATSAVETES